MEKIKTFVLKNRNILLIAILFILLVGVFVILSAIKKSNNKVSIFNKISSDKITVTEKFLVTDFFPNVLQVATVDQFTGIRVTFSEPVEESSIVVEIYPDTRVEVSREKINENIIWIKPINGWDFNRIYKINIKEAKSTRGKSLDNPYIHEFSIVQGKEPMI